MGYATFPSHPSSRFANKITTRVGQSPITYAAWRYIPTSYLLCTEDKAIPLAVQEKMVERAEGKVDVVEKVNAGHSPFLSQADVVERLIRRAASEVEVAA
jgi:pimeloyl-ACP methyl ester carboxylesterase